MLGWRLSPENTVPDALPEKPDTSEKLALFRTYRPQDFSDLVGQEHVQRTILNALKLGRASHAYLFSGPRGTGKTTTARLVAKGLLCPELLIDPTAPSSAADDIVAGRHLDLLEIDAASNRGIDEIRDLRDKVRFSPSQGPKKVFIIDEVHMLTTEAFNALLKTLEEPPAHAHFILATTELHKVPSTIISRCQHFAFRRIPDAIIAQRLRVVADREDIQVDDDAIALISHAAQGSMRDGLVLLEQVTTPAERTTKAHVQSMLGLVHADAVQDFLLALLQAEPGTCLRLIHELYEKGADLAAYTPDVIAALRHRLVTNVQSGSTQAIPFELRAVRALEQALLDQRIAGIPELPLELAVIELLQPESAIEEEAPAATVSVPSAHARPAVTPIPTSAPSLPKEGPATNGELAAAEADPPAVAPEVPTATEAAAEAPVGDVLSSWPQILSAVLVPTVRFAAKKARISQPDAKTIVLSLGAKFEVQKLNVDAAKHALDAAILAVTGEHLTVRVEHDPSLSSRPISNGSVPPDELANFLGGRAV